MTDEYNFQRKPRKKDGLHHRVLGPSKRSLHHSYLCQVLFSHLLLWQNARQDWENSTMSFQWWALRRTHTSCNYAPNTHLPFFFRYVIPGSGWPFSRLESNNMNEKSMPEYMHSLNYHVCFIFLCYLLLGQNIRQGSSIIFHRWVMKNIKVKNGGIPFFCIR